VIPAVLKVARELLLPHLVYFRAQEADNLPQKHPFAPVRWRVNTRPKNYQAREEEQESEVE
jgi:hypothetical protein